LKIIATPAGEAPEWVRQAWVGCKFTEFRNPNMYNGLEDFQHGVLGGEPDSKNKGGFGISCDLCLATLRQRNLDAWGWWIENTDLCGDLIFGQQFCKLITINE